MTTRYKVQFTPEQLKIYSFNCMEPSEARERILCVEDHEDTREVISALLTRAGFEVVCAENPHEALDLVKNSSPFDLYIVDTWLPGMSGLELSNNLRQFDGEIPILFFTAAASEADRERAIEAGADAYLIKPVDTGRLAANASRLLSESKKRRSTSHRKEPS